MAQLAVGQIGEDGQGVVDAEEIEIDEFCLRLLALRQPAVATRGEARDFTAIPFRSVWWPLEGYRTAGWEEVKALFGRDIRQ